jgi:hypothetical protein
MCNDVLCFVSLWSIDITTSQHYIHHIPVHEHHVAVERRQGSISRVSGSLAGVPGRAIIIKLNLVYWRIQTRSEGYRVGRGQ